MVPVPAARPPVPLSSAGGAPVRPRRASSRATPTPAAPAQSYWQNATSFFVWYTVSTNCRSSGESV